MCSNAECSWQGVDNFGRWRRNWCVKNGFGYFEREEEYRDAAGVHRIRRTGYHGPNFHSLRHTRNWQVPITVRNSPSRIES